jgi:hypothetical protein
MATSPNFNWPEPDNTDLVKNGALAIRTAVNAIDTSLVDLKGGTTGQVLAKASGTDMDFSWVAQDDSNAIQNAIVDAKGDIIAATANDTPARLAVGANDTVLTADSTTATGLKWAAPASGGGMTLINTGGTALSGSTTTVSSIPTTYNSLVIYITDFYQSSAEPFRLYLNGDTTEANYGFAGTRLYGANLNQAMGSNASARVINLDVAASDQNNNLVITIPNYANTTAFKTYTAHSALWDGSTSTPAITFTAHRYASTTAVTQVGFNAVVGTFSGGTMFVYGVK